MSDLPSTAIVALACLMLWRADRQRLLPSLMAGLLAGVSLLFREPLIVLLAPLLAGALARRRIAAAWLVLGFVLGVGLRAGLSEALFASPLYLRDSGYGFSLSSLRHGIPVYIAILLLMIPGGAVLPFLYRGERRAEIVTAFALYLSVFLFYEYDSIRDNGLAKGLILASRFMVPLAPLLAFMASEVWPRFYASARARVPLGAPHVARLGATIAVAQCFLVHPLAWAQERVPLSITGEVYANTTAAIPVVTNSKAMMKYLSPSYGPRRLILLEQTDADSIPVFARRFGRLGVAILDRNDSEMFRRDTENNARFLAEVDTRCSLRSKHHAQMGWATLRILEITACR